MKNLADLNKDQQRQRIAEDTAIFLALGGKIQHIPIGRGRDTVVAKARTTARKPASGRFDVRWQPLEKTSTEILEVFADTLQGAYDAAYALIPEDAIILDISTGAGK